MNNCGIYIIYNTIDDRVYIGSSKNLKRRLGRHFSELKYGTHKNQHLQRFVTKYGIDKLKYKIIENCDEDCLLELEINYIEKYDSLKKGFNLQPADRHYFTEEHKDNIRKAVKISKSKNSKIIKVIKEDKIIFKGKIEEIKNNFNIDTSSVYKILKGIRKTHKGYTFSL